MQVSFGLGCSMRLLVGPTGRSRKLEEVDQAGLFSCSGNGHKSGEGVEEGIKFSSLHGQESSKMQGERGIMLDILPGGIMLDIHAAPVSHLTSGTPTSVAEAWSALVNDAHPTSFPWTVSGSSGHVFACQGASN